MPDQPHPVSGHFHHILTRRAFLKTVGVAAVGALVAGCRPKPGASKPVVAIAQAASYDPKLIRQQVQSALDKIGGIADILKHGNRAAIKVNITGSKQMQRVGNLPEVETYHTHPEVVRATGQLLRDAGITKLYIVEAVYAKAHWHDYGWDEVAKALGATLVDLNDTAPYNDFATAPVPGTPNIYEQFTFNHVLGEIDTFVSIPKMKCHNTCGVTHSLKNLVGLVPYRFYTMNDKDEYRSGFHGPQAETPKRLPGVIMDLNRARPINLAVIDGVMTVEGGEGPWVKGLNQLKPGVLIAGKDPVAADAIATAVMGFDPQAEFPSPPFVHAYNHLNMAHRLGLGTNVLDEINVVGAAIADVRTRFKVSY
ncbi:MAG: DUF362 domain-containing protein [Anaerolineae bacterium]